MEKNDRKRERHTATKEKHMKKRKIMGQIYLMKMKEKLKLIRKKIKN